MLNYQRLAQASLIGHGGMQLSMYNSSYPDGLPSTAYLPGGGGGVAAGDQAHFYPNLVSLNIFFLQTFFIDRQRETEREGEKKLLPGKLS